MSLIGLLTATEKQVHLGRLHMRPIQWHLKSNWRIPESLEKVIPLPRSLHPHLQWWLQESNVLTGETITPHTTCSANLYRRIKRRVGCSLKRVHYQRKLVPTVKQTTHKLSGAQSGFCSITRVSRSMRGQNGFCSNRQHHSSSLYQQGRGYEVRPTVCLAMEKLDLMLQKTSNSESQTHSRPHKCSGGQAFQTGSDHPNRMVPPSGGFLSPVQQVAPASNRSLCYEIQQQVAPVCLTSSGSHGHCSGRTQFVMGESGRIRLPTDSHIGQSGGEVVVKDSPYQRLIIIAPGWPNMTWFWDLVEMSSQIPLLLPQLPNLRTQPFNQAPHRSLTNLNLHAWLLEPQLSRSRVSLRRW